MNKVILQGKIENPEKRFTHNNEAVWNFKLKTTDFTIPASIKSEKLELIEGDLTLVEGALYGKTINEGGKFNYISAKHVEMISKTTSESNKNFNIGNDNFIDEEEIPF